jgi:hypothetical protein
MSAGMQTNINNKTWCTSRSRYCHGPSHRQCRRDVCNGWLEGGPPFPALYLTGNAGQCSLLLLLLSPIGGRLVVLPASCRPGGHPTQQMHTCSPTCSLSASRIADRYSANCGHSRAKCAAVSSRQVQNGHDGSDWSPAAVSCLRACRCCTGANPALLKQ